MAIYKLYLGNGSSEPSPSTFSLIGESTLIVDADFLYDAEFSFVGESNMDFGGLPEFNFIGESISSFESIFGSLFSITGESTLNVVAESVVDVDFSFIGESTTNFRVFSENVDIQLVLVIDSSSSMSDPEYILQRDGYRDTFVDPEIVYWITNRFYGIAVCVIEFANTAVTRINWTLLQTEADCIALSNAIGALNRLVLGNFTSITAGLTLANTKINEGSYFGRTRIIDVSGDGRNNFGGNPSGIRDIIQAQGITINGLVISLPTEIFFYERDVVTSDGFVLFTTNFGTFTRSVRYKLLRELGECIEDFEQFNTDSFNREIIFDMNLGAFYMNDFSSIKHELLAPRLHDYIRIPNNVVADNDRDRFLLEERNLDSRTEDFKLLCTADGNITIGDFWRKNFKDWGTLFGCGFDYNAYTVTGPLTLGAFSLNQQSLYLNTYLNRTETMAEVSSNNSSVVLSNSSCLVRGIWDWHGIPDGRSKWTREFEAYQTQPHNSGEKSIYVDSIAISKHKLRGRGRSLILVFKAGNGKDMQLLGWSLPMVQVEHV